MATDNKDFKIKNGLIVEGATASVNGNNVITEASSIDDLSDVNTSGASTGQSLVYSGGVWGPALVGGGAAVGATTYITGPTAPLLPESGDIWFNTSNGLSSVYYDDGDTEQWIEIAQGGLQGPTGPETSISIGTTTTGDPGTSAFASVTGPPGDQKLDLTIPQGPTGPETSISIGTITTGTPAGEADASITGPAGNQVIDFTIPQGPTGPTGPTGATGGEILIAETAPSGPVAGDLWFDSANGKSYFYYSDTDSNQWVELTSMGPIGPTGPETTISLGTVTTSLPGESGDVSITGPAGNQILSFVVPQGPTGPETSIELGTVTTGDPGTTAAISITGPAGSQIIDFTIPQGPTGPETSLSITSTTTGDPGTSASVTITGPAGSQTLDFTVPQGPTGPATTISIGTVTTGDPGTSATATITGPAGNQTLDFGIPQGPTGPTGPAGSIGTVTLDNLNDVSIDTPADNEILAYDDATSTWINQTQSEAGLVTTGKAIAMAIVFG